MKEEKKEEKALTLIHKFPVQMMCWILPGTSMDLNFGGKSGALSGIWRSPKANTSTILLCFSQESGTPQCPKSKLTHQTPRTQFIYITFFLQRCLTEGPWHKWLISIIGLNWFLIQLFLKPLKIYITYSHVGLFIYLNSFFFFSFNFIKKIYNFKFLVPIILP